MTGVGLTASVDHYRRLCLVRAIHWFWRTLGDRTTADAVLQDARLDRGGPARTVLLFVFAILVDGLCALVTSAGVMLVYGALTGDQPGGFLAVGLVIAAVGIPLWVILNAVLILQVSTHPRWYCRTGATLYLTFTLGLALSFVAA